MKHYSPMKRSVVLFSLLTGLLLCGFLAMNTATANDPIFRGESDFRIPQDTLIIDEDDAASDLKLQFGNTLNEYILWDNTNLNFQFSNNITLSGNQLLDFRIENFGSAPTCDGTRNGRLYYNTVTGFSYVCSASSWKQIDTSSYLSESGGAVYISSVSSDFAIGGSSIATSVFSVDEGTGTVLLGGDQSVNPSIVFEATDSDSGTLAFNTNDTLSLTNAVMGVGIATAISPLHMYENTTNSDALAGVTIEQEGTGDAVAQFLLTGVQRWVMGVDNSDSDMFKIASSQDLNTDARLAIDTTGNVTIGNSTLGGGLTVSGEILSDEYDLTTSGTIAIDWDNGNQQSVTLNQTGHIITFANASAGQILRLVVCQDGTGSRTVTGWPASIDWSEGVTPVLTTTASKCDVLSFVATDERGSLEIFGAIATNF